LANLRGPKEAKSFVIINSYKLATF